MTENLKVIIVDDEYMALEVLEKYITNVPFMTLVGSFRNPIEALDFTHNNTVDAIFLDINMPDLTGLNFAKIIKDKQRIIFTTAYTEFAVEGFNLDVTDYLLKPIEYDRFLEACYKVKKELSREIAKQNNVVNDDYISIKSGTNLHRIKLDDLLFLEKLGNDMLFHTKTSTISSRMNMQDLFDIIPESTFCRVHKSFVVAIDKIDVVTSYEVMIENHKIPLGRSFKEEFLKRIK